MRLFSWLYNDKQANPGECHRPYRPVRRRATFRPRLEKLEDRTLLSSYTAASTADLIADINAANKAGGTNTITLAANTTFNLTAVNNTTDGANGLPVIQIIHSKKGETLTIIGNGDTIARSTAAGTPAFRLFDVAQGNALTLQNVTLQNGLAQVAGHAEGGAILNQGTLSVSGSALSGNSANDSGGGICNRGTLTVSSSTLSGNSANNNGGGIKNDGTATITGGSTLSGNSAGQQIGTGGGIRNDGTLTVSGSTLSANTAGERGGGIYNLGTLTVSGSTLSGNTSNNDGGGIDNGGTLTVSDSTLFANVAAYRGGGIYNTNNYGGTVTVENSSSITGNSAPLGFGADVYNLAVLYLDISSIIGILDGNPAVPI